MKQYPKRYEDIILDMPRFTTEGVSALGGSIDALVAQFQSFLKELSVTLFELSVKAVWLEGRFVYQGVPRRRFGSKGGRKGYTQDSSFAYFMKTRVGATLQPLSGYFLRAVQTYFLELFPGFFEHNPFTEPAYFAYPYNHITLDHLLFVYQCHNRLALLQEADEQKMGIKEFSNWAVNWILSYCDEIEQTGAPRPYGMLVVNRAGTNMHLIKALKEIPKQTLQQKN